MNERDFICFSPGVLVRAFQQQLPMEQSLGSTKFSTPTKAPPSKQKKNESSTNSSKSNTNTKSNQKVPGIMPIAPSYMTPTKASLSYAQYYCNQPPMQPKRVYLIRHGESMGQTARHLQMDRRRDSRLRDCGLTEKGILQASALSENFGHKVDVVISSPLTRAIHTAMLGFVGVPIIIDYALAEMGSKVPENHPRPSTQVLRDLKHHVSGSIDTTTYAQPDGWPDSSMYDGDLNKQQRVMRSMKALAQRPEATIAIVCHFHVIQTILKDWTIRPVNASPLVCTLHPDGRVELS